ncbi:MAG: invasion associated locus B family protein [Alphaproteobacteria bacterium]|nr:invasion associated locus B family protein [Alphaproteobacteria bacterium]MBV9904698.1 invasion associated locus B family protein [Alphaproteobacteria bacterium]
MNMMKALSTGALALGLLAVGASAQTSPPPGGGQPLQPSETKNFGDWQVRCYPIKSPSPCDMYELLANKQTQQRIMSVSIAFMPNGNKHVIQIGVPLGVAIQKGLTIESDTYTSPQLHYRRCDRGGCYVEMLLPDDALSGLSSATSPARVKVFAEGKPFEIPFSLNGFNDAHGAMQDLARKKTQTASAATPPAAGDNTAPAATTPPAPAPTPTP